MLNFPDEAGPDVGAAFADPAFAELKARGAPFAILHPAAGEVLWANAAAAAHWGAGDAAGLARALFGAEGRGGWLDGLARGLGTGAGTALFRGWTDAGGRALLGLAVPAPEPEPDREAWRRPAWADAAPPAPSEPEPAPSHPAPDAEPAPDPGESLARRGQLAVLRDRLSRALDGAATARLLWRTDRDGALVAIDAGVLARLGSPLRADGRPWPEAVAPFDRAGAERLRDALAGRATWSGLSIALPVAGAAAVVPLALSASPVFGPGRGFEGYRGFGTVDLGRIAPLDGPGPDAPPPPEGAAPRESAPPGAEPPAPPLAAAEPAPRAAEAAPAEAGRPANVVQLRAFQPPPRPAPPPPIEAEPPGLVEDEGPPGDADHAARGDEAPLSDQLAFLALGEALRARIASPSPEATPPAGEPEPALRAPPLPVPPEAALLDRLPLPALVTVDGRPAFANAAAAARLGHADPASLLAAAVAPPPGSRRVDLPWGGEPAVLWLLPEEPAPGAPPRAPDRDGPAAALLDRVDDAVALLDAAGRVRRLNSRGEGWFSPPGAEPALGRPFAELLAPESRPAALALLGEVRDRPDGLGEPPLRREVAARAGEGEPVPMILTLGRLGDAGFYATLRDQSALRRAETDRVRTERDRARAAGRLPDLLAKVSHEVRTPLGSILGFAEVMMDERFGPLGNPRYRDYLKDIHAAGAQVVALVDDLLDLSRVEAGQLDLAVSAVDLNRIVAETVAQMQPEAHQARVIMRSSLGGRVSPALADERSARQIVKNLLSNAVKFNEPGGQVIVSTAQGEAGAVLLRVRDTGVGMADEQVAAAMEPFGGFAARAPAAGNGLGLPLTRALVGANGAGMTIRSRPGEGTLVEVAFAPAEAGEARLPA